MYDVRGSWVGQTFALATSNDSGGRKSRIRRSKEERKAMVVSFINKYQSLNEGNFPSLNLTHKEVGGSFYTVRQIVREIIQENKILGPAIYSSEVEKDVTITEDYPLGTISREPQGLLCQTGNEMYVISNHQEKENVEQTLEVDVQSINHSDLGSVQRYGDHNRNEIREDSDELACRKLASEDLHVSGHKKRETLDLSLNGNGQYHDESESVNEKLLDVDKTIVISEESDEKVVNEEVVADANLVLVGAFNAKLPLPTEVVEVETFPLKLAIKGTEEMSTFTTDICNLNGSLNDMETKQFELSNGPVQDEISSTDCPSDLVASKEAHDSKLSVPDRESSALTLHAEVSGGFRNGEVNLKSKTMETPDSSTIRKDSPLLINGHMSKEVASSSDLTLMAAEQSRQSDGLQPINAPKERTFVDKSSRTSSKKNDNREPILKCVKGNDTPTEDLSTKGSSPTLDRIQLESWPRTSQPETNPVLAFIKAFADAFIKFWSE